MLFAGPSTSVYDLVWDRITRQTWGTRLCIRDIFHLKMKLKQVLLTNFCKYDRCSNISSKHFPRLMSLKGSSFSLIGEHIHFCALPDPMSKVLKSPPDRHLNLLDGHEDANQYYRSGPAYIGELENLSRTCWLHAITDSRETKARFS